MNFFWRAIQQHSYLYWSLSKRDVAAKYKGSSLGLVWVILNPLLMLLVYGFVFGIVFQARWPQVGSTTGVEFPLILFCGLIVFFMFSEIVNRSPMLIVEHANYVKKVVFPLPLLSCVVVTTSTFHYLISFLVMTIYAATIAVYPSWSLLYLPLLLLQFVAFCLGLSWFLSAVGVFLKDMSYVVGFISTALMFLCPIFYPIDAVPEKFRAVIYANPLTYYVESFRGLSLYKMAPDANQAFIALVVALIVFFGGLLFFNKVRHAFSDVV